MKKEQTSPTTAGLSPEADQSFWGLLAKEGALPFSEEEWQRTPEAVRVHLLYLCAQIEELKRQVEHLQARLHLDSGNSNKPPSSDSPFQRKKSSTQDRHPGRPGALLPLGLAQK